MYILSISFPKNCLFFQQWLIFVYIINIILLLYILFFCSDAKEKNIQKKRKHADHLLPTKFNLRRVNSLHISSLRTCSAISYRSNSTRFVVVSLSRKYQHKYAIIAKLAIIVSEIITKACIV